jgi:thymidylate synthase
VKQYLELCQRIVDQGEWVENERTGKRCLTVINADLTYDVANNQFPLVTTRKSFWKAAVAELLGYIRGYDSAEDFRKLGTKTWDANANLNQAWLNNPYRKGEDDMGRVYGVQGRAWAKPDGGHIDQLRKIVDDLSRGNDDRGEILNFWNKIPPKKLLVGEWVSESPFISILSRCFNTSSHYQYPLQVTQGA